MKKPHILIIDDDKISCRLIRMALEELGYPSPDVALSGIEALNILENQAYDLILLDNRMPGMTGVDFLKIFSTSRFRKNTKVLLVTAEIRKNIELDINKANISIDGILSKPFNINGLLSAISDVL